MPSGILAPDLSGRHVLIPGGTGGVGEGAVRAYLAAGADVVVPTRSQERRDEFRRLLGDAATGRLHLVVHDYTTFAGAEELVATMQERLGSVDDVVAPIGGWWAGKPLWPCCTATVPHPTARSRPAATQHDLIDGGLRPACWHGGVRDGQGEVTRRSGNPLLPPDQRNEPAVRPATIRRCANSTSSAMGIEMITTAASMRL